MAPNAKVRVSFLIAVCILAAGLIFSLPGLVPAASLILAVGQFYGSSERGRWFRAAGFLALGVGLASFQFLGGSLSASSIHPDVPLAFFAVLSATAMIFTSDRKRTACVAVIALAAGLYFSSRDRGGESAYWRAAIIAKKAAGNLPYLSWPYTAKEAFGERFSFFRQIDPERFVEVVGRQAGPQGELELYRTALGDMWAPAANHPSVALIVEEMTDLAEYEIDEIKIKPGDVVIDCGGHVGFYTKLALSRGAELVVAFEPDPENYWCFRENLKDEIADGRVKLIQAGVWDKKDKLTFFHSTSNPGAHGFFRQAGAVAYDDVPVAPLDDFVAELGLDRVDWIKMDIEGAEQRALNGAAKVLQRFKPHLAICTYHRVDDHEAVLDAALGGNSSYSVSAKRVLAGDIIRPKVLFFH